MSPEDLLGGLLPPPPASREAIREWDRRAAAEYGLPGVVLMENAALGSALLFLWLRQVEPERFLPPCRILCGPGNNGGDGLALARQLHNRGVEVSLHLVEPRSRINPASDAGLNLHVVERMGLDIREPGPDLPLEDAIRGAPSSGVVIDAMLGTGLTRPLRSPYRDWVEAINRSGRPTVSLDIPTGLDADTGEVLGAAVRADHTFTMAAPKLGFSRGAGPAYTGRVHVVPIGMAWELLARKRSS